LLWWLDQPKLKPLFYTQENKQENPMLKRFWLAVLLVTVTPLYAGGLDIGISKETAYLVYLTKTEAVGNNGADLGFGFLYTEDDDYLLTADMLVVGNSISQRNDLEFGVGVKGYAGALDTPDKNIYALALGAQGRYVIPSKVPMGVVAEGFYAPSITSFGDTEKMREFSLRYEIQVVPNTLGYVGYRFLETELDGYGKDVELDNNVHLGIRLIF
jgi:hypothetical protein